MTTLNSGFRTSLFLAMKIKWCSISTQWQRLLKNSWITTLLGIFKINSYLKAKCIFSLQKWSFVFFLKVNLKDWGCSSMVDNSPSKCKPWVGVPVQREGGREGGRNFENQVFCLETFQIFFRKSILTHLFIKADASDFLPNIYSPLTPTLQVRTRILRPPARPQFS